MDSAPKANIFLNGSPLNDSITTNITKLVVELSLKKTSRLTLDIGNHEGFSLKASDLKLRSSISVDIGYGNELYNVFSGELIEVTPKYSKSESSKLSLVAVDKSYLLKKKPLPNMFTGDKFSNLYSVAKYIANKHNLLLVVSKPNKLTKYKLSDDQSIDQKDSTDWEILSVLAKTGNYKLFCSGNTIYIVTYDYLINHQTSKFELKHRPTEHDINYGLVTPLFSFSPKLGIIGQRDKAKIITWKYVGKDPKNIVEVSNPSTDGNVGYTDIKIQSSTIETIRVAGNVKTKEQAKLLVEAELQRRADNIVVGELEIQGNPQITLGTKHLITLTDLGDVGRWYSGDYYVTDITHTYSISSGYTSKVSVRRSGLTK